MITYSAIVLSIPGQVFHYSDINLYRLILSIISMPMLAFIVGFLGTRAMRVQMEKALREKSESAERRVRHILESITDAFIAIDRFGRIAYINAEAERLLGDTRKVILGKNMWEIYPSLKESEYYSNVQSVIKRHKPVRIERYFKEYNKWLEVHVYPTKEGIAIYFNDIGSRKELERQRDTFISMIAHELKTPVTTVKGYIQLLQQKTQSAVSRNIVEHEPVNNYLLKVNYEINRLNGLINDLLDASRAETGKLKMIEELFDLNELIENIVEESSSFSKQHKLNFRSTLKHLVIGDKDRIKQVLINLIQNAVKYSPNANEVVIRGWEEKNQAIVSVRDHGIGITPKYLNKIFDRFYRIENPNGNVASGLGLGLYISSEIIKGHGGKIWVESKLGKGSTFYFSLPIN